MLHNQSVTSLANQKLIPRTVERLKVEYDAIPKATDWTTPISTSHTRYICSPKSSRRDGNAG